MCRHLVGHTGISDAWETLGRSCLTEGRKIKLHGQCLQEDGLLPHREPLPAWSLVPVQPSPSGLRCIPGGQMHMKVPMRFLQSIPRVSQSCSPSAHSSRSATENLVRPRPTCQLCGTGGGGGGGSTRNPALPSALLRQSLLPRRGLARSTHTKVGEGEHKPRDPSSEILPSLCTAPATG